MNLGYQFLQQQSARLSLTPQIKQSIQILQLSSVDLVSYLQEQSAENPLLDISYFDRRPTVRKTNSDSFPSITDFVKSKEMSLEEHLVSQMGTMRRNILNSLYCLKAFVE